MPGEHIAEQTDGKRDGAEQQREDLDDPHEHVHGEGHSRRSKALEIPDHTMLLAAEIHEVDKGHEGEGRRAADCARARLHARDEADEIVDEDEEEDRGKEREVLAPFGSHDALGDIVFNIFN